MPKIAYLSKNFGTDRLSVIERANQVLAEYAAQGFDLTLRQLYYQFVARGWIPNKQSEYKRLGETINEGRLAGLIDWDRIVDRTRNLEQNNHWDGPEDIVEACASQFQIDKWAGQENYVEVWIEKDALAGILEVACKPLDVAYFSCRGYTSQSELWSAAMRLVRKAEDGRQITIVHLGDHDPSGIDMTRDIRDRLKLFMERHGQDAPEVLRVALNMDQVEQYNPPPNPAKTTDSRYDDYIVEHGEESWELDALEPAVITALIQEAVGERRDEELWERSKAAENRHKRLLSVVSERWSELVDFIEENGFRADSDEEPPEEE